MSNLRFYDINQHTKFLAILHKSTRRSLDEGSQREGHIIEPEEAPVGVKRCAPMRRKVETNEKGSNLPEPRLPAPVTIPPTTQRLQPFAFYRERLNEKLFTAGLSFTVWQEIFLTFERQGLLDYHLPCMRRHCQMRSY